MDKIFGRKNRIGVISVETNPGGRSDSSFFATSHEYFIVYAKNIECAKINDLMLSKDEIENKYIFADEISHYARVPLRRTGSNSTPDKRPNLLFPIFFNPSNEEISLVESKNNVKILPVGADKEMRVWRWFKNKILENLNNLEIKETKGKYSVFVKDRVRNSKKAKTLWYGSRYDASSHGTKLLQKFNLKNRFSYPKSVNLLKDILQILTNKNDIVIDYHAGSGTTAHAILSMNKEDGGNRKFILVEQMDYINTITVPRIQEVMRQDNIENSFLYFELAEWNEQAKEEIKDCKSLKELEKFFRVLYEKYFLNYNVKNKNFQEKILKEDNFKKLSLGEQKRMFLEMLDLNQMYIQKTEMADKKFGISKEDQKSTKKFYND